LLAHPNRNPVSTTELVFFQKVQSEFSVRGVKLIAIAPGTIEAHQAWYKEINESYKVEMTIPIIADKTLSISLLYDMLDNTKAKGVAPTVRDVFVIDPNKAIRLIFSYPVSVGGSVSEVIRVLDCLQTVDASDVLTPAEWHPGESVIVNSKLSHEQAQEKWDDVEIINPIVRMAPMSIEDTTVPTESITRPVDI